MRVTLLQRYFKPLCQYGKAFSLSYPLTQHFVSRRKPNSTSGDSCFALIRMCCSRILLPRKLSVLNILLLSFPPAGENSVSPDSVMRQHGSAVKPRRLSSVPGTPVGENDSHLCTGAVASTLTCAWMCIHICTLGINVK